ncbi:tetratricopeptide repeat protein [Coralloluteibacterium stylophorae]|uniref:protein O-GlcNAc transferase n=1 Tax=Coralloluteibacterium stylophorae TaxID=1776034 RepID=A0A8J7VV96_9GAMM|nr:tetratricopeptide repeat protein [Coralloluteibacterium stylophorae]MBS7456625.1 tetratricopeptide repeat protein [Coralloluteibacterium stylophorae]
MSAQEPRRRFERLVAATRAQPGDPAAWRELALFYLALGQADDALPLLERALACGEDLPARLHLSHLRLQRGEVASARAAAHAATALAPASPDAWFLLAEAALAAGDAGEATAAYLRCTALAPRHAQAWHNLGLARDAAGDKPGALAAFEHAHALAPAQAASLAQALWVRRELCDWRGLEAMARALQEAVDAGAEGVTPFSFLAETDDPRRQRRCATTWARGIEAAVAPLRARLPPPAPPRPADGEGPLRIGLVSSGFNDHPTALLVVDLVERLRGTGIEVHGFATRADDGRPLRRRLAAACHAFADVSGLAPTAMAARLRDARLDACFDLRGYGDGAVSEVFALRVAPVQVNWLAYPGTSGAGFIDVLLADRTTVDAGNRDGFSEPVVRLPHCFQPSDTSRAVGTPPPRAALGLPERAVVLASFNNPYKITPAVFACWMRVLAVAPDTVLWLLAGKHARTDANLRAAAQAAGIDPARLVFAHRRPHPEYLALYRHADLFLDTWPYGAHTTASDALWAGCPLLTLPGRSFASRVGASLLATLGLDAALVARDADDYVARATALAGDAAARAALRDRLAQARAATPLFDMAAFARDFAAAVRGMVARSRAGLAQTDLDLPPSSPPPPGTIA